MILKWILYWPIGWALTLLTWALSPALALPMFVTIDKNGREQLIEELYWFQTFDAPLDEWRVGTYWQSNTWLKWDFTNPIHRYLARVFWLCRNPAYGFGQFPLGADVVGAPIVTRSTDLWDSGKNNWEYSQWVGAFNFRAQWFFTKTWFLRINIGWKAHSGFSRLMLATHIWVRKFK